jgi:hypothetical protein
MIAQTEFIYDSASSFRIAVHRPFKPNLLDAHERKSAGVA